MAASRMSASHARPVLAAYNSVERMLHGDFFHTVHWREVVADLASFPAHWSVTGVGTSNWFHRNGEVILSGTAGNPSLLWSDPECGDPLEVIDLLREFPASDGPDLVNPDKQDGASMLAFPFLAMGVSDPADGITWECGKIDDLHGWICEKLEQENIGMAAVTVEGRFSHVQFSAASYLPLEGLSLEGGYAASRSMKLAEFSDRHWKAGGIHAAHPTLQRIISVEGLPLHLHGLEMDSRHGGHVIRMSGEGLEVKVSPLRDLVMRIRNLDHTWLPERRAET